ncbi:CehA/McbA family metallohydrolase [Candidatus Sumerlaeota bacterium]|nr:CehA/McbA family metallohydrolase [Candidatus Sumerlaeota bacterium]
MKSIFPEKGQWLKGILHVHSTESDGWISPQRVMLAYEDKGYDFICLTDHWKVTPKPQDAPGNLVFLPGVEVNGGNTQVGDYHVVGIDVHPDAKFDREKTPQYTIRDLIDMVRSQGGLAVIAHPSWNGVTWFDLKDVAGDLMGLEVYNTGCDMEIARGFSEVQWDDLLSRGFKIWGLAVDDTHRYYKDHAKGWVMVKAASKTPTDIRQALEKGHFYASIGPSFYDLQMEERKIHIKTSPVKRMDLVSNPMRGETVLVHEPNFLTEHVFSIPDKNNVKYIRIRITDEIGHEAWSNPIFV